jgi:hypothetical protein
MSRHISLRKENIKNYENELLELERFSIPPWYGKDLPLCIHVIGTEFVIMKYPNENEKPNKPARPHRSVAPPVPVVRKKVDDQLPGQLKLF